ncbi:MAG: trigger factor [Planctomycetes bacterium]|nr:trigger factor [Planctomycetota bacterium]
MADTATMEQEYKVSITDAGPSRKKLHIEIPAERVSEKLRGSVDIIMGEAALPGFRKGKAPRWLVEKQFGSAMRKEAKSELVSSATGKAIEDNKLKVLNTYRTDSLDKAELVDGKPLAFEVDVEVLPEFDLPELNGIAIRKPLIEVSDQLVQEEITKVAVNEGQLESRDSAEPGDYCTGHAVMKGKDGTEFYNLKGAVIQIPTADKNGKGMVLGIVVDDFAKQVGSPKPGETVTIKAKGPDQHEVEGIRGNDLTVSFKIERIDRIIPATMEQLTSLMGFSDETGVRQLVRDRLEQRAQLQQQQAMHSQLARHLIKATKMELPELATAQQAARTFERRRMELMYRGVEPAKIEEHVAEMRSASAQSAASELKLFFILNKAAEVLDIKVTEGEINQRIALMAQQRGVRPERLRQELIQTNQINGVFRQIGEHKTLDAILANATVTEMPVEEFNKVMKDESTAA